MLQFSAFLLYKCFRIPYNFSTFPMFLFINWSILTNSVRAVYKKRILFHSYFIYFSVLSSSVALTIVSRCPPAEHYDFHHDAPASLEIGMGLVQM